MTEPRQSTMRAAVLTASGGPEVLAIRDVARPTPAAGEVLVRVRTSALNRADLLQRAGVYPAPPGAPPDIGGIEFAGEVASLGAGVRGWSPGDRVFAICGGGAHAEWVTVPAVTLVRIPEALDWDTAGAIPEAFMTAHDALRTQGGLQQGESVVVHAVASGVGLAVAQLGHAFGARVFGTTRTPAKLELARQYGMSDGLVMDRELGGLRDRVLAFTSGRGAEVVIDLLGGPYVAANTELAAVRGRIVLVGAIAGSQVTMDLRRLLARRLTLRGTVLRSRSTQEKAEVARGFEQEVVPLLSDGRARAHIDRIFDLADIQEAHRWVESNSSAGKVVIRVS
ncbi:MAG: NAD(P)H-quinone oxidoreductase [Gemmatimonadetes bacterium]|nr:NAD(P)H-quinone oxidoreductase [Gemmatimonadota bacterium]